MGPITSSRLNDSDGAVTAKDSERNGTTLLYTTFTTSLLESSSLDLSHSLFCPTRQDNYVVPCQLVPFRSSSRNHIRARAVRSPRASYLRHLTSMPAWLGGARCIFDQMSMRMRSQNRSLALERRIFCALSLKS